MTEEEDESEWATDEDITLDDDEEEEEEGTAHVVDEHDNAFSISLHPSQTVDAVDDELIREALRAKDVAYIQTEGASDPSAPPQPTEELRADSGVVGLHIRQIAWFARKLRYNTRFRRSFEDTCANFKLPTPHSLIRDVATRWNSTMEIIERALQLWDAITTWQEANARHIPAKFRIKRIHKASYEQMLKLLKPLGDATAKFSSKRNPTIADVVGTFEELDALYRSMEDDEDLPLAWREAARRAGAVCSAYYGLADGAQIYYLAVLLHPNLRTKFMKVMKWEQSWIDKAKATLSDVFDRRYRIREAEGESQTQPHDQDDEDTPQARAIRAKEKQDSFVARQLMLAEEESSQPPPDPVEDWCKGNVKRWGCFDSRARLTHHCFVSCAQQATFQS